MDSELEDFKKQFSQLGLEQKFQILIYYSKTEMKSFVESKKNLNPLIEAQLLSLAPYLLLPSKLRKTLSRSYLDSVIEQNDKVVEGFNAVKDDYLITKYYPFDDPELAKSIYAKALHNKSLKKNYATDLTIIKKEMQLIVHLLKEEGLTVSEIGDFFYDVFYHFNFEKCRNHDPGTYQKKVYMMIKRL